MATIDEISPDVYRISIFEEQFDLQFNHFLVKDEEPLLYHAGMRRMFPELHRAVAKLIDPSKIRWISRSSIRAPLWVPAGRRIQSQPS